tara:strand:+ start:10252 stop:10536 length:285 start_codon:yes stop_codon:yes gene_type:complete
MTVSGLSIDQFHIQAGTIIAIEPSLPTISIIRLIDGHYYEVAHTSLVFANRTLADAINSALLHINSYENTHVVKEVILPTIGGVPITISGMTYT